MADENKLRHRFAEDGYVCIPGFLTGTELAEVAVNVDRFIANELPGIPLEQVFYEDKSDSATLKQIQHLGDHDPYFHELFNSGRFRRIAEMLLGGPVVPKNMQYFNKPPGIGLPTPPHQDGFYFKIDPCEAVTMWFALDNVDEENGCVRYVRGSHLLGLRDHSRTQTLGFSQGIGNYPTHEDIDSEIAVHAKPGDLLVHHAMTIHRADGNRSERRSRKALGFIYYSDRAREDEFAHREYQRQLAEEMMSKGKI